MADKKDILALAVDRALFQDIRQLAHRMSLSENREVRWTALVRDILGKAINEARTSGLLKK